MLEERGFRSVMGHFVTGVTIVTGTDDEGGYFGLTVNSVASVSLDPLLVLVCLDRSAASHDRILESGAFAISVLGTEHAELAARFSSGGRDERFEGVAVRSARTASPIVADALAWLDCAIWGSHEAGDHTVVIGEVLAGGARDGDPLVFFRGTFGTVR